MPADRNTANGAVEPWEDPNAQPFISIEGVTKRFGDFTAVDNVSLNIYKNELFCLLGGSGCGKSTLLRMLAGFETATEGRILIDGADMTGVAPYDRQVNMMFQSYALFPHMTVEKNVAYGLKHEDMNAAQIKERVENLLELVQLSQFATRKPHQLSGGQRQRVALARALAKNPKLLLLDEPLGALDKKLREQTQFELMNIQEQIGVTFIVVTHDQEEAMTLASRIAVMDQGIIRQVGTPTDIYEFPGSRFVADFIGSINLFDAEVGTKKAGTLQIESKQAGCKFELPYDGDLPKGTAVTVAVRPEKISIEREKPSSTRANAVSAQVVDLGYFGKDSLYRARLSNGEMVRVTRLNEGRIHENERQIDWDDEVWLSWHPSSVILLAE